MKKNFKFSTFTFVTFLLLSTAVMTSCGSRQAGDDSAKGSLVDNYSINKASQRLCGPNLKLTLSSSVLSLDLNNFIVTGTVKSVAFSKGTNACLFNFKYDPTSRLSTFTGQINAPATATTPTQTYSYDVIMQNSNAGDCITNGSAWEVISSSSNNGDKTQIFFRNLSDSGTSQSLVISADKLMKAAILSQGLGISAYTCQ